MIYPKIKLIALDLDGTLLTKDKRISQTNADTIAKALAQGIHIVLASGRMHSSMMRYVVRLDISPDSFVISYNGGLTQTVRGHERSEIPLNSETAKWLVRYCADRDLHLNYYLNDVLYVTKLTKWSELYQSRVGSVATPVGDLTKFDGSSPTKALIVDNADSINRLLTELTDTVGKTTYIMKTDDEYLEFMNPLANKGAALSLVAKKLGIDRNECLAFGDNYNDLPMLEWAGESYAMENGRPELLQAIPLHAPPADEDGVSTIIRNYLH